MVLMSQSPKLVLQLINQLINAFTLHEQQPMEHTTSNDITKNGLLIDIKHNENNTHYTIISACLSETETTCPSESCADFDASTGLQCVKSVYEVDSVTEFFIQVSDKILPSRNYSIKTLSQPVFEICICKFNRLVVQENVRSDLYGIYDQNDELKIKKKRTRRQTKKNRRMKKITKRKMKKIIKKRMQTKMTKIMKKKMKWMMKRGR